MAITPDIRSYLGSLASQLDAAAHGQRGALMQSAEAFLGWSRQTIYRQLKAACGWAPERKVRADKGSTSVDGRALTMLAAVQREAIRDNGKQTLFTTTARGMLEQNDLSFTVGNAQLNRLIRDRKMNVAAQRNVAPVQSLRALHPNHVHEVDPSLCLLYYLKGRQHIMREREFYKNKLQNYAKIKLKCYRYVLYDRASGMLIPWYCEAEGENQHNLFEFLMFAWGQQTGRINHGPCDVLLWDKGSANSSSAIQVLLGALGVKSFTHEAGHARVKGGVENGNNIIETQFESRLRFEPVADIRELNERAFMWANAYNANQLPNQDSRLHREGLAAPVARTDLWLRITAEQLRILPSVEVCRALMTAKEQTRKVRPDLSIEFKHPAAPASCLYRLAGLNGVAVGDKVSVRALVYGDCAIQVEVPRYDGEMLTYRVEPDRQFDDFGQSLTAPVIGQEYHGMHKTEIEHAADAMDQLAYPGMDADEIKKARDKKVVPFENKLNAHSYLEKIEMPTFLPKQGQDIETPVHAQALIPKLSAPAAMIRIAEAIGRNLTSEENAWLEARHAGGVPEDQIDALIAQFKEPVQAAQKVVAGGGLRVV